MRRLILPPVLIAVCVAALGVACDSSDDNPGSPLPTPDGGADVVVRGTDAGDQQGDANPDAANADADAASDAGTDSGPGSSCTPGDDLAHAPPAMNIDGLPAVPIDIHGVDAKVTLDAATKVGTVDVTMRFKMGAKSGYPIFDLRQTIQTAKVNGTELSPQSMELHDFSGGDGAELRIIAETNLAACSENTIQLTYTLGKPASGSSIPLTWGTDVKSVNWDFWLGDLIAGRYLEMWFPANLIYDKFGFNLDIDLKNVDTVHVPVTNGTVTKVGETHWQIAYPERFTALSPMLKFVPENTLDRHPNTELTLQDGTKVQLELVKEKTVSGDLPAIAKDIETYLNEFVASSGPYQHGDRLTVYIWNNPSRSMEFDGATTSNLRSLKHELYHSWFARGVKPALGRDGWFDEAWTVYNTDSALAFEVKPFNFSATPVKLAHESPWRRLTPGASYSAGEKVFAGLAHAVGLAQLREAMKEFARLHARNVVTTEDLEKYLYCTFKNPDIVRGFHRFVYGRYDAAPTPDGSMCTPAEKDRWVIRPYDRSQVRTDAVEATRETDPELKRLIEQ
ncbi:hypothetical protein LZC95_51785 [Pendulispora brunnea]|uniref:Peptidase M61 catalytic domain-containing protein n=1 Tax=Pendulispora brunnea TaxID=2905690 RepID=A0ABZ2K880_9BACT